MAILVVGECKGCKLEKHKFQQQAALRPTDKPHAPMEGWSIDLITDLDPISDDGHKHCIVAIDCFSKWCEIHPIRNRKSETIAQWFYHHIVCRFGKPKWVRVDKGREFMGQFTRMCAGLGTVVRTISSGYPRSNG